MGSIDEVCILFVFNLVAFSSTVMFEGFNRISPQPNFKKGSFNQTPNNACKFPQKAPLDLKEIFLIP